MQDKHGKTIEAAQTITFESCQGEEPFKSLVYEDNGILMINNAFYPERSNSEKVRLDIFDEQQVEII